MKKTILSFAVLLASIASVSASAQTTPTQTCQKAKTECSKNCAKKDAPKYNPFAGLNLTEKQQSELQALKAQCKNAKTKDAKTKEAAKAEKQAQKKQMKENRLQGRRDYLAKVKTILTPEQYMQFLENNYINNGRSNKHQAMKGDKNRKGHKGEGRRGGKQMKPAQNNGQQAAADGSYYIDNGLIKVFPYHAQN